MKDDHIRLEMYDNVDNKAATITKDSLLLRLKDSRAHFSSVGSIDSWGSTAASLLLLGVFTENFRTFESINGEVIRGLVLGLGFVATYVVYKKILERRAAGKRHDPEEIINDLFSRRTAPIALLEAPKSPAPESSRATEKRVSRKKVSAVGS